MYPISTADSILDILKLFKEVKPLFDDPKNIDSLIVGLEQAKETFAKRDEVLKLIQEQRNIQRNNESLLEAIADDQDALKKAKDDLENREAILSRTIKEIEPAQLKNMNDAKANEVRASDLDTRQSAIEEREATIRSDMEEATRLKKLYAEKVRALNNIPEGE